MMPRFTFLSMIANAFESSEPATEESPSSIASPTRLMRVLISDLYFLLYSRLRMLTRVAFVAAPPIDTAPTALRCCLLMGCSMLDGATNALATARQLMSSSRVLIGAASRASRSSKEEEQETAAAEERALPEGFPVEDEEIG